MAIESRISRKAIELCRAALCYRSPDRDGVDWAYSQLNLAGALNNRARATDSDQDEALAAFSLVVEHRDAIAEPWLVGQALASMGRIYVDRASPSAEEQLAAHDDGTLDELFDNVGTLDRARECLEEARGLVPEATDPVIEGRVLRDLSAAYDGLGLTTEAISAADSAVRLLRISAAPGEVVGVASRLGSLRAGRVYRLGEDRTVSMPRDRKKI